MRRNLFHHLGRCLLPPLSSLTVGCLLVGCLTLAVRPGAAGAEEPAQASASIDVYLEEVKPLLRQKCYACHGALKQQGGLRLDTAEAIRRGGDSGSPLVAGAPDQSLLMEVLTGEAGFRMPPASEGVPLTPAEIQRVGRWILSGAQGPPDEAPQADPQSWWSYRPVRRPALPEAADPAWCRSPLDRFIAAARDQRGLPTAAPATKTAWLRRVHLDLAGLPPTREQLHRFLEDDRPEAYESVVDRLLASTEYGERWGRHWMDIWRYSDWYGSRGGNEIRYGQRHSWRWRDWIIASLNQDQGYDQMVREMIAGDELADDDLTTLAATGYLGRNWYKFDRDVWLFETVERTGEAFLGLTLRCCRCHDHKYDPIRQQEYYQFRAYFEPHDVRTDPLAAGAEMIKDAKQGLVPQDGLSLVYDKHPEAPTYRLERGDGRYPDETRPLSPATPAALGEAPPIEPVALPVNTWYPMLRDGARQSLIQQAEAEAAESRSALGKAVAEAQQRKKLLASAQAADAKPAADSAPAVPPAPVLHDTFAKQRPDVWEVRSGKWKWADGKLVQSEVGSFATIITKQKLPADMRIRLRYRTLQPGTYRSVGFSFDVQNLGESQDVYTSAGDAQQSVQAFHRTAGQQVYPQAGIAPATLQVGAETTLDVELTGSRLTIDLNGDRKLDYTMPKQRRPGKFALWVHQGAAEFQELQIHRLAESVETLAVRVEQASRAVELARLKLQAAEARLESVAKRIVAEQLKYRGGEASQTLAAAREAAAAERKQKRLEAELAVAGAADDAAREKAQATLDKLSSEPPEPSGEPVYSPLGEQYPRTSTGRRRALAEWIASEKNPRTARVAVNHIWGRHFGVPLVTTPANFGLNGHRPSHPLLLDWLASELIAHQWRMKPLHRQIVLSATYRMSTRPVFRESGKGSPSDVATDTASSNLAGAADPFAQARRVDAENRYFWRMRSRRMEAELVRDATLYLGGRLNQTLGGPEIPESQGATAPRRSLYFRNTPNEKMPLLEIFDVADPNACYRRKESIVPHQSLVLMNSGLVLDSARRLAAQLADERDFVEAAFETVLSRPPNAAERDRCERYLQRQAARLATPDGPVFAAGGDASIAPARDPARRAQENLVHVLLLHNDFVTIR